MRWLKRIIGFLDRITDAGILCISLVIFFIGAYAVYDSYLIYVQANDTSLLKYRPGYGGEEEQEPLPEHMTAWLTLDDTGVDYPVMQGEDNYEYLNKDPYGAFSLSGSIFLDFRNQCDFSDEYSLIYGHHMEHGLMFGALDDYLEEDFFRTHKTGTLTAGDVVYAIHIFAVLETDAANEAVFAPTETPVEETLAYIKEYALYLDEENLREDESLLGLSTCKYPDTADRTIVFCTMERE